MKNKIVLFNFAIVTISLLIILLSGISVNKTALKKEAQEKIVQMTEIYAANYNVDVTKDVPDGVRLTVVDKSGIVLADSADAAIVGTQHIDRAEILAALNGKPSVQIRRSDTLKKDMAYYALKVNVGGDDYVFVRTAIAVDSVNEYVAETLPTMIFVLVAVLVLSYLAGVFATDSIIKPLAQVKNSLASVKEGACKKITATTNDKEVNAMLAEINELSEKLQDSMRAATTEKERLDYVLGNISDGIVVLDDEGTVTMLNDSARAIFCSGAQGRLYTALTADKEFNEALAKSLVDKTDASFDMDKDGKIYIVAIRSLKKGYTVVVLTDITAVKNSQKMRGEFFENASHELKTPLTAIKGFNDIILLNTAEQTTKELSGKIDKEVCRIITLINDMLDLSRLEKQRQPDGDAAEVVDLAAVAQEVKDSLSGIAQSKNVTVTVSGGGKIKIEKEHAVELVKNLVENGIRYNDDGGKVNVDISQSDDGATTTLTVSDDGIGIEERHQSRIFERFYRVNKSRSRETGGTGLGLAIVKHICSLYGADISLTSAYGVGTTVKITFKKQ